jgi:hypothetical protein
VRRDARAWLYVASALLAANVHAGCKQIGATSESPIPSESPQASAVPALLASAAAALPPPILFSDAGPPAPPLRGDLPFPSATYLAPLPTKDATYLHVDARLTSMDLGFARRAETLSVAAESLRKRGDVRLAVDLGYGRMLLAHSGASLLPTGSKLRSRVDQLGFLLETQEQDRYRVVAPGALRALWAEGRFDVAPATPLEATPEATFGKFGTARTRRVRLQGSAGSAIIEIARIEGAAENGVLLLRMLEELLGGRRSSLALAVDELPVRAEYRWSSRGGYLFEVTAAVRKNEPSAVQLTCPSERSTFDPTLFRPSGSGLFYSTRELETLRAPEKSGDAHGDLRISSQDAEPLLVWVEGVPIAVVAPRSSFDMPGLRNGQYNVQLRTFFDDRAPQAKLVTVPGRMGDSKSDLSKYN